ncbi:hypothetical protein LTR37_006658 [Vermiconidia calcicola]|uniref:Uncharacterized protein n=1 Tax=Vermiconidia calcicola TaxID=1690605 RepID=A0ACC3NFT9_9PEZI|nr:hypothetical protein LTR37_006658 [Vermiconidia calcicola]
MFDENTANDATDPQTLSAASTEVLQNLIDHHGAVELIKRLSSMLAERDAHITALTRLAEEYKMPRQRISETASRAKQAERRRLSLITASEDLGPSSVIGSDSSKSQLSARVQEVPAPSTAVTKLFGGTRKRRESMKPPRRASERPRSIDQQSIKSNESTSWAASMNVFGTSGHKRNDSLNNRLPVEMTTRHDKDQLPPTLSNQSLDPQEAEWNKFMVRLVEQRQETEEDLPGGELIGASHFGKEGSLGRQKMETLTRLVVGGIPMKLRHPLWMELSNTQSMMQPNTFSYYLSLKDNDDPAELEAILKDVPRTLTSKYDFYSDKGYKRLKEVLVAFVAKYPSLGYTQGLNTIAGYLLLAIPAEEDAFWVLCNIVENFFPEEYFSRADAMVSPLADNNLLRQYIKELMPQLSKHIDGLRIFSDHTVPLKWFFTAFSSALPETILMRIWDVWLCLPNQKHFLFAFALALLSQNAEGIMECEETSSYFSYMDSKLKLPEDSAQLTELIKQAYKLGKRLDHINERRAEAVERFKTGMQLDNKLRLRKTQSLEVLVDREETPLAAVQGQDGEEIGRESIG